jgi:methylated-DNA-protein-cysteine methyltransferase related protein
VIFWHKLRQHFLRTLSLDSYRFQFTFKELIMDEPTLNEEKRMHFNQLVWEIARQIPPGRVAAYGQIASLIPAPEGIEDDTYKLYRARWAGSAMRECPADVPWQRVLNAQGKLSLPRESRGYAQQKALLESEGIAFDARDRIDLKRFGWEGPSRDWLVAHGLHAPEEDYQQGSLL